MSRIRRMVRLAMAMVVLVGVMQAATPASGASTGDDRLSLAPPEVEGSVIRLYQAALDRTPDAAGVNYWIWAYAKGYRLRSIAYSFIASEEYQRAYGGTSDEEFVRTLYRNILGREGEPAGLAYWTGLVKAGKPRHEVLMWVSESLENQYRTNTLPPRAPRKFVATPLDEARVIRLHLTAFGAPPSDGTADLYAGRLRDGWSLQQVADQLRASAAFAGRYQGTSDRDYARSLHANVFGAAPSAAWLRYWEQVLTGPNGRRTMLLQLAESVDLSVRTQTPLDPSTSHWNSTEVELPPPPPSAGFPLPPDAPILVLGDSVMNQFQEYWPGGDLGGHPTTYNTIVGGRMEDLPAMVESARTGNVVYDAVIIHLGTNNSCEICDPSFGWDDAVLDGALESFAPTPVLLVNIHSPLRSSEEPNNALLAASAARYGHVKLFDWNAIAGGYDRELFAEEELIHLTWPGMQETVPHVLAALESP